MEHMPLVRFLVNRVMPQLPPQFDPHDLMSAGTIGLIHAADRFEPSRGVMFKTFAEQHIRGAILDELRSHDVLSRSMRDKHKRLEREVARLEQRLGRNPDAEEIAAALSISMDEYHEMLEDVHICSFISLDDSWEDDQGNSVSIADTLKDDEAHTPQNQVMKMQLVTLLGNAIDSLPEKERLAVTLYYHEDLNLKEIGAVLGVSESRVSQILSQAMARLKGKLRHQR